MKFHTVVCPHCGYVYSNYDVVMMPNLAQTLDGDFDEVCVECGKEFVISMTIRTSYETRKREVPS